MKTCSKKKHPFTIVLTEDIYKQLAALANKESRPVAQMARVIIEKELATTLQPTKLHKKDGK